MDPISLVNANWSSGDAGNINVNADSILISGVHNEPNTLPTGDIVLPVSGIVFSGQVVLEMPECYVQISNWRH